MIITVNTTDSAIGDNASAVVYLLFQIAALLWILIANLFFWIVLRITDYFHRSLDYFIACVIVVSYIAGASAMPLSLINDIVVWKWTFGNIFCELLYGFDYVCRTIQAWAIFFIIADRVAYHTRKEIYNEKSKKVGIIIIVILWLAGVALCLLIYIVAGLPNIHNTGPISGIKTCHLRLANASYSMATSFLSFFIPVILAIIMWIILLLRTRKRVFYEVQPLTPSHSVLSSRSLELTMLTPGEGSPEGIERETSMASVISKTSTTSLMADRPSTRSSSNSSQSSNKKRVLTTAHLTFNEDIIKHLPPATSKKLILPKLDHHLLKAPLPTEVRFRGGSGSSTDTSRTDLDDDGADVFNDSFSATARDNEGKPGLNGVSPITEETHGDPLPGTDSGIDSPIQGSPKLSPREGKQHGGNGKKKGQRDARGDLINDKKGKALTKDKGTLIITDRIMVPERSETPLPNVIETDSYLRDSRKKKFSRTSLDISADLKHNKEADVTLEDYLQLKKLGLVIFPYFFFWLPFYIMYILLSVCSHCDIWYLTFSFLTWLGYLNAAINPFIYYMTFDDFRKAAYCILNCTDPNEEFEDHEDEELNDSKYEEENRYLERDNTDVNGSNTTINLDANDETTDKERPQPALDRDPKSDDDHVNKRVLDAQYFPPERDEYEL